MPLRFNQPLKDWDVSSCKVFARMFSGVREDGFAQDVSSWNVRNDANTNNMFLQNDAYAAKFYVVQRYDSGPPSSCREKSVSEMIAEAMIGTDEKGERKSKSKHSSSSSKRRTSSNKNTKIRSQRRST